MFLMGGVFFRSEAHGADPIIAGVQAIIKARLGSDAPERSLSCQGETICGIQLLPSVYRKNAYIPLWIDTSLYLEKAEALAKAIGRGDEDGLAPSDYHLNTIHKLLDKVHELLAMKRPVPPEWLADLDLILTDAFLLYGSQLTAGRVNPEKLDVDWKIKPGPVDLFAILERAASTGDIDAAVAGLRPDHSGYEALRAALERLRNLRTVKGWPMLDDRKTLRPGDRDSAVDQLRRRLAASGDIDPTAPVDDALLFDTALMASVKHFQQRHGLKTDGVVGRETFGMLNVPLEQRIRQLVLNLERWRWLPHDLGGRYIIVNTADFNLKAVENGQVVLQMRVVVGRPARRSPVFSAKMTYLVINPYWHVPTTIAVKDILPEIRKDVAYLEKHDIRLFSSWDADAPQIDPATVDWQAFHANRFPFMLRQDPGAGNAMGRIKFMLPNPFAVYLHDTPNRSLFKSVQRDFSSGCIRVEAPFALADFVLAGDQRWTPDEFKRLVDQNETRTIWLRRPVPVHLVYMTAWVDESGTIQFRSDIYDRDRNLECALNRRRPAQPSDFIFQLEKSVVSAGR